MVIYCRASTGKQEISPEAQEQRLRQQAQFKGFEIVDVLVDKGISGGKGQDERPGLRKALTMLEEDKANTLMVTKLDRLSRSVSHGSKMIEQYFRGRYDLVVLEPEIDTTTDFGEFTANLMLNIGQLERRLISTRTAEALEYLSSQGVVLGGRMFGWRHTEKRDASNRRIREEIPKEQEAIKTMIDMRSKGETFDRIAMRMNMDAIPTALGGKWYRGTVQKIIKRVTDAYKESKTHERPDMREKPDSGEE